MPQNPPEDTPRITPYLFYEDVPAALQWLADTFGFSERLRINGPDGSITHAEMQLADGMIMLGRPGDDYKSPKRLGQPTQSLYVYVDDVDKHFQHASEAGAKILQQLQDQPYGDRTYGAEDPEGHQWYFGQHVRDVSLEEVQQAYS